MKSKDFALLWMSAGNSYFSEETIGKLLTFADKKFENVLILSPDKPAEHTFRALGYTENNAIKKAKLNANLLKNRAERQLKNIKNPSKFHFVDWQDEVITSSEYNKRHKEILSLYHTNTVFKEDARQTTQKVILSKFNQDLALEKVIDEAVLYLIEELAFVLSCSSIYSASHIFYLYHQPWQIYENLIAGKYDGKKRTALSFVLTGIH